MNTAKKEETFFYTAEEYYAVTRNYDAKTELHEGEIVYQASPSARHNDVSFELTAEFKKFVRDNQGKCKVHLLNFDVQLTRNIVLVPDVVVICDPDKLDDKRCYGAPDLVVEVVSSDRKVDFVKKLHWYEEAGVKEYWIVDLKYRRTHVYVFADTDTPVTYEFDEPIPVGIWDDRLHVTISEYLS